MISHWGNAETLILFGGLDGRVFYRGAGLTPMGKEPEAKVGQMLASASAPARTVFPRGDITQSTNRSISAERLRAETTASTKWIAERLHMGTWKPLSITYCAGSGGEAYDET